MLRLLLGCICLSAVMARLAAGPAVAAPVTTAITGAGIQTETSLTQEVHWVWHHHHRIWVSHRHHYRHHHYHG